MKCECMKWIELSGILCDKRMPIRLEGKFYKTSKSYNNLWIIMLSRLEDRTEDECSSDENVKVDGYLCCYHIFVYNIMITIKISIWNTR